jgi:hypothetical protein
MIVCHSTKQLQPVVPVQLGTKPTAGPVTIMVQSECNYWDQRISRCKTFYKIFRVIDSIESYVDKICPYHMSNFISYSKFSTATFNPWEKLLRLCSFSLSIKSYQTRSFSLKLQITMCYPEHKSRTSSYWSSDLYQWCVMRRAGSDYFEAQFEC